MAYLMELRDANSSIILDLMCPKTEAPVLRKYAPDLQSITNNTHNKVEHSANHDYEQHGFG